MKKSFLCVFLVLALNSQAQLPVRFKKIANENKIAITIGGKLFTNYYFPGQDILKKAVLYPVLSPSGQTITRGWPLDPKPGERVDHPHHVGVWLNYEDANGHDFWNNSNDIDPKKRKYGTIVATGSFKTKVIKNKGELDVTADWLDENKGIMLKETTKYVFTGNEKAFTVDRITTLKAVVDLVNFKDVKDGFFAIRVNRNLEHPSKTADVFTDASGIATKVPVLDNTGVTGNYKNAEGIEGEKTWSLRSPWVTLEGMMENGAKSVTIFDHKKNLNYPSYWHTRGYGLFSVNPLGEAVFTKGEKTTNLNLKKGEEITFRYRLTVADMHFSKADLDKIAADFDGKY
jgi:Methane oxygenase PmoA